MSITVKHDFTNTLTNKTQPIWFLDKMTTVHRFNGYRIVIWLNDHRPAHVHVIGKGGEAIFKLHCPDGPPELREVYELSAKQVKDILEELTEFLSKLCEGWSVIHGQF